MIIPDYIFNEMLSITKVFSECRSKSIRHDNAIRKGVLLHKKLLRIKGMSAKKTLSQVKVECDIAHGDFIKDRDCSDGFCYCISCKKSIRRSECEAGHYIPRQHMSTRWDERNVNAQCHHCNYDLRGNISGYTMGLMDKYGHEIIDELIVLSKQTAHFSTREIEEKTKYFKQKRREL